MAPIWYKALAFTFMVQTAVVLLLTFSDPRTHTSILNRTLTTDIIRAFMGSPPCALENDFSMPENLKPLSLYRTSAEENGVLSLSEPLKYLTNVDYTMPFPVYYINLDRSPERKAKMEAYYGALWDLRRSAGILGKDPEACLNVMGEKNYAFIKQYLTEADGGDQDGQGLLKAGELGAILSHMVVIRQAYLDGAEAALILEDDTSPFLMPYWTESMADLIAQTNSSDWGIIQVGFTVGKTPKPYQNKDIKWGQEGRRVIPSVGGFEWGAFSYVISRKGMEYVLDRFFEGDRTAEGKVAAMYEGWAAPVEYYLDKVPNPFIAMPPLFMAETSASTIGLDQVDERLDFHRHSNQEHLMASFDYITEVNKRYREKI